MSALMTENEAVSIFEDGLLYTARRAQNVAREQHQRTLAACREAVAKVLADEIKMYGVTCDSDSIQMGLDAIDALIAETGR